MKKLFLTGLLLIIGFSNIVSDADAAVRVRGYYRKDGTYVQPHYRSAPDSSPYNNWSYPGNVNPYTGKIAGGNPDTYLKNYDIPSVSVPTYSKPVIYTPPTPISIPPAPNPITIRSYFIPTTISPIPNYALTVEEWVDSNPNYDCLAIRSVPNFSEGDISKCNLYRNNKNNALISKTISSGYVYTLADRNKEITELLNQLKALQAQLNALLK